MKSIDRLVTEHRTIERGLALLEAAAVRIDSGEPVPEGFASWAPDFFADFADRCHHAKEEDLLFPALRERGIPGEGGPIGMMLHEHDIGRGCVRRMREAAGGEALDQTGFSAAAREFATLLRGHILKEDNVLFQMAASVLSDADDVRLDAAFTDVERVRELSGLHARYEQEVAQWEEKFA